MDKIEETKESSTLTSQQILEGKLGSILSAYAVNYAVRLGYDKDIVPEPPDIREQILRLFEPKPDESRLLTDAVEILKTYYPLKHLAETAGGEEEYHRHPANEIIALTASIKDAEYHRDVSLNHEEYMEMMANQRAEIDAECDKKLQEMALNYNVLLECKDARHLGDKMEYGESVAESIRALCEAECQARIEALIEDVSKLIDKYIGEGRYRVYIPDWKSEVNGSSSDLEYVWKELKKEIKALKATTNKEKE